METSKATKPGAAAQPAHKAPTTAAKTAPLFRPIDWFTLIVVMTVVMIGYWLTISPDCGLEDSG